MDKVLMKYHVFFFLMLIYPALSFSHNDFFNISDKKSIFDSSFKKNNSLLFESSFSKATYNRTFYNARLIYLYQINKNSNIGIGLGKHKSPVVYNYLLFDQIKNTSIFIVYKYDFKQKNISPFIFIYSGFQFQKYGEELNPFFYKIGTGYNFKIRKKKFYSSVSYEYNKSRFYSNNYYNGYSYWYRNHIVDFAFGIKL